MKGRGGDRIFNGGGSEHRGSEHLGGDFSYIKSRSKTDASINSG